MIFLSFVFGSAFFIPEEKSTTIIEISSTTTARVMQVIDGDTIDVNIGTSSDIVRVRYVGINTPEPYAHGVPDCGSQAATDRNRELVAGKNITLVPGIDQYDTYGRLLAYVYSGDIFVNKTLLAEGFATVMMIQPNTVHKTEFTTLYKTAKAEKRGIWAECT